MNRRAYQLFRDFAVASLVGLVRCYQAMIRPFLIGSCKYYPSCSEFAIESLRTLGPVRGAVVAMGRLCRCHPFAKGGYDPVNDHRPN